MAEHQSSYRSIMKATSLFGGVQVLNIMISIIRSKVVAILLGPLGMGIIGLLQTTISLISSLTNFGLGSSAVKEIAAARATNNQYKIGTVVNVFRRLVWATGLLGLFITLLLSPWLSQLTFGNSDYTVAFAWISLSLLFAQLTSGQLVILQGLRKLKLLAKANVVGNAVALVFTIPLYYFYNIEGIIPSIIITALITFGIAWFFSRKITVVKIDIPFSQTYSEGKSMLKMGFLISLSGLLTVGASYVVRIFISQTGSIADVGLYTAGFAIITNYVGLIFNAMGTDYFPRLSAVANNLEQSKQTINQQAEIAVLILAPILLVFLTFIDWGIILLYSKQFLGINGLIYWAVLGIFFKAASWAIAFIFLAKGASKLFFINELIANCYMLVLNITGYYYLGLTGLGISFTISYLLYLLQVYWVSNKKYEFQFKNEFVKIFAYQLGLALVCFLVVLCVSKPYSYLIGSLLIGISSWFSYRELDKRMDLYGIMKRNKRK